ncbi:MAG: STAS domain-containing protein [Desulfobacterales bacterium]|nr:MAG: STAS domain-containing protein [Desulfobacterales bacterium]
MEIIQEKENGIIHIIIKGRLDSESAPEANRIIKEIVGKERIRLLLNICDLEYLSSDGLRVILQTAKEVYKKKGQIVLCCPNERVRKIFESTKLMTAESVAAGIKKLS